MIKYASKAIKDPLKVRNLEANKNLMKVLNLSGAVLWRKGCREVFCKKFVLKTFTKYARKFLIKLQVWVLKLYKKGAHYWPSKSYFWFMVGFSSIRVTLNQVFMRCDQTQTLITHWWSFLWYAAWRNFSHYKVT